MISKRHVVEPFELSADEQAAFWRDCMLSARAAQEAVAAKKVNYEIHGNTVPHLHMHIFPRHPADPFVGRPIDGSARNYIRSHDELRDLQQLIGDALRDSGPKLST